MSHAGVADDVGNGPAKEWLARVIKEDKAKYNKFAYRLRSESDPTKAEWEDIKKCGTAGDADVADEDEL